MITDIILDLDTFILELPKGAPGGNILSYSMDGSSYDFQSTSVVFNETSSIFIN